LAKEKFQISTPLTTSTGFIST